MLRFVYSIAYCSILCFFVAGYLVRLVTKPIINFVVGVSIFLKEAMPADESTAEVSRLLDQWDTINRSPLQLSAILAGDTVLDMASAEGDTHLVAVLARLLSTAVIVFSFCVVSVNNA